MTTDRQAHWEQIYRQKSPEEVSWYQRVPELSLQLIQHCGLSSDDPLIDVGGGSSTLVDCLLERGYGNISVLDISETALQYARTRLGAKQQQVRWYAQDVLGFSPRQSYACWHDRAVFHFLVESRQREAYVDTLRRLLRPAGQLIIAAFSLDGPKQCSGLDIVQYDAEKLMMELGDDFELLEQQFETHTTPGGAGQRFRFYRCRFSPDRA